MVLGADGQHWMRTDEILEGVQKPSWDRIFRLKDAIRLGVPINKLFEMTKIDKWYLYQIQELVDYDKMIKKYNLETISREFMLDIKQKGYSDAQIAYLMGNITEDQVYDKRHEMDIRRVYKLVDTCAAEFEAQTPYYYSTFEYENESKVSDKKKNYCLRQWT